MHKTSSARSPIISVCKHQNIWFKAVDLGAKFADKPDDDNGCGYNVLSAILNDRYIRCGPYELKMALNKKRHDYLERGAMLDDTVIKRFCTLYKVKVMVIVLADTANSEGYYETLPGYTQMYGKFEDIVIMVHRGRHYYRYEPFN